METLTSKRNVEFVDKLATFSLDDLRHTVRESEVGAAAKSKIFHYDFINDICELLDRRNIKFAPDPIYVREGGRSDLPNITRIENIAANFNVENPLESQLIRNLTGKLVIHALNDDISYPMLAFSLNQLGQQVAFGAHVSICSNGCIFGPNIMHTYGGSKLSVKDLFFRLGEWMDNLERKRAEDVRFITGMRSAPANHRELPAVIGNLLVAATKANPGNDDAPLNVSLVSDFAKEYVKREKNIDKYPIDSVWDVYNIGTRLLNPDVMRNHESALRQNRLFGEFILKTYNLNPVAQN